jgi:hypothetical protein
LATDLEELACIIYSVNPYSVKHGDKKAQWEEVVKGLKDKGLFLTSSVGTIRNKMTALLTYFEVGINFSSFDHKLDNILSIRIPTCVLVHRSHKSCPELLLLHITLLDKISENQAVAAV